MNDQQQWDEFTNRLNAVAINHLQKESLSSANLPRVLRNGFRYGVYNLDTIHVLDAAANESRSVVLATRLSLPPNNLLNLALVFSGDDLRLFIERITVIKAAIEANRPPNQTENRGRGSSGANNVRVYLHDGGIYLWQHQGEPDEVNPQDTNYGPKLRATTAYFSDVISQANLKPVEIEYVTYLTALLGDIPFRRLDASGATSGSSALNLASLPIADLKARIARLGGRFTDEQVERYHVAQTHLLRKHFVILTGISGTGKTMLARAYAYAALGVSSLDLACADFFLIPVHPEWTEPTYLLGYLDALSGTYRRTPFLDAILHAHSNSHRPVFVCLDEMNIAQPEYYFADVLSAMETGADIRLHSGSDNEIPRTVSWPTNLHITGTVNVDETTRSLSPKVLDRSNVIDMSNVSVADFCDDLTRRDTSLAGVLDGDVKRILVSVSGTLQPCGLHFGYRTIEEIARYLKAAQEMNVLVAQSLDVQIEQKILTKLRGGPEMTGVLDTLAVLLGNFTSSRDTIVRLQRDLEHYGSFQYWT